MLSFRRVGQRGDLVLSAAQRRNVLSRPLLDALIRSLRELNGEDLACLTLTSASADIFAAGADIRELAILDGESAPAYAELGQELMALIAAFPVPVLALVAGPCFGGALDLALACDAIWAAENAVFCHPGIYLGIMTGFGGTVRLPARLPVRLARHMMLTGYRMPAREARRWGLVEKLFANHGDLIAATGPIAQGAKVPGKRGHP